IELPGVRSATPYEIIPGPFGGHNWHSMSFNPALGLAFIPAQHVPLSLADDPKWRYRSNIPGQPMSGIGWNTGSLLGGAATKAKPFGRLIAWDP
ncbi:hypothetical protein, partial [Glaesserella parasuis]|uniref:hypothetical protein n=1 Tax=Glaesserella parasuis TaxID=738 RepID=UPI003F41AE6C